VDGGGLDGGQGMYFANAGDDVHGVGSLMPAGARAWLHRVQPDGTRLLARVEPDPLA
jgi:hypothetical protein